VNVIHLSSDFQHKAFSLAESRPELITPRPDKEHQGSSAMAIRPLKASCFLYPDNSEDLWRCNLPMILARSNPSWFTLVVIRSCACAHSSVRFLPDLFSNRIFSTNLIVIESPIRFPFHDATQEFGIALNFINKAKSNSLFDYINSNMIFSNPTISMIRLFE
jgi:hypothetical protein